MKKQMIVLFLALFFVDTVAWGQSGTGSITPDVLNKIIPPPPIAATLGKYGDIPVSMYTGTPNIDVPIYNIQNGDLSLPISLSYHASGIKVADPTGFVAVGWALNAGGVITRTVRGLPDETGYNSTYGDYGYLDSQNPIDFPTYTSYDPLYNDCFNLPKTTLTQIVNNNIDVMPDMFVFNFAGQSGKFVFDQEGNIHTYPAQNLKITPFFTGSNIQKFEVIIADGTKFIFETKEIAHAHIHTVIANGGGSVSEALATPSPYTAAWYITRIESPNQVDFINFTYQAYSCEYLTGITGSSYHKNSPLGSTSVPGCERCDLWAQQLSKSYYRMELDGQKLSSINSSSGINIDFVSTNETITPNQINPILREIVIKQGTIQQHKFMLTTDLIAQTGGSVGYKRGVLHSVQEFAANNIAKPPYTFEYNHLEDLPNYLSYATDHWGYYNGATNNDNAFSNLPEVSYNEHTIIPGTHRETNTEKTLYGILTRISYPTGGYTNFEFEAHDYPSIENKIYTPHSAELTAAYANGQQQITTQTITFGSNTSDISMLFGFDIIDCPPLDNEADSYWQAHVIIKDQATNHVVYDLDYTDIGTTPAPNTGFNLTGSINNGSWLFPGTYVFTLTSPKFCGSTHVSVEWKEATPAPIPIYTKNKVGGARIKSIASYTSPNQLATIKEYAYTNENNSQISSGVLFQEVKYLDNYVYVDNHCSDMFLSELTECGLLARHTNIISSIAEGSHIGYATVTEIQKTAIAGTTTNGKTVNSYTVANIDEGTLAPPYPPLISFAHRRGLLSNTKTYKQANTNNYILIAEKSNTYNTITQGFVPSFSVVYEFDYPYNEGFNTITTTCTTGSIKEAEVNAHEFYHEMHTGDYCSYICHVGNSYFVHCSIESYLPAVAYSAINLTTTSLPIIEVSCLPYTCCGHQEGDIVIIAENPDTFFIEPWHVQVEWVRLQSETQTAYDENGLNPITSSTTYAYNNPIHLLPTTITQTIAGDTYETRTKYPADYPTAAANSTDPYIAAIGNMSSTAKHMHNYPIEVLQLKNGKIIGGSISKYKTFDANDIEINEQYNLETANAIIEGDYTPSAINGNTFTFDSRFKLAYTLNYNATGDISSFVRPKAGKRYKFIWGTNHKLTSQTISYINNVGNSSLPTDQTTTYTYDPIFRQLSTLTDLNGKVTAYTYDGFGRLINSTFDGQVEKEIGYHYGSQTNEAINITLLGGLVPTVSKNYICTRTKGSLLNISYIDGLGQPIQNIAIGQGGATTQTEPSPGTTTQCDIIEHIAYDAFGRQANKYLPYTRCLTGNANYESAIFDADALNNQKNFYNSSSLINSNTAPICQIDADKTFAATKFEPSPLNRPIEQGFAGTTWAVPNAPAVGANTLKMNYLTFAGLLQTNTTDENGKLSMSFSDTRGRLLVQLDAMGNETAYIYNDMDRLESISSPAGTYFYGYDERARIVGKVVPGKQVEYFVYDPLDRLVLQQDGKMRQSNKWLYTKYDYLDRPIETGFYTTTQSRADLQTILNTPTTYDGATGFANLPTNNTELLTQTTYDPIGFKGQVSTFTEKILFPNGDLTAYNNILAQAGNTSSITTNQIVTTYTYDSKYRITEKHQSNHLGGTTTNNVVNYTYNNFDQVQTQNQAHQVSLTGVSPLALTKNLYYDRANRLREIWNNGTITAHHNYNPIGQLTEKKLHRLGSSGSNFLQTIDYRYNARAWLTQINQIALSASGDLNSDAFAETITYQPNGNILSTELKNAYPDGNNAYNATDLQASYTYDPLNRLLTASTTLTLPATGNYSEAFSYNQAGNILSLQRNGKLNTGGTTGLLDNLLYSYPSNSNQLKAVEDLVTTATTAEANDFEEQNHLATEYFYDANGNMMIDGNKKLLVTYNHLNLPTLVFYPQDGKFIMWVYTATGTKLQKYVCSTSPKNVWDQAINIANNNIALQNPDVQYGKRFANISSRRTAATQTLTPIQLYQHLQDTIALVRNQAIANTSTGTYQEPQSLFDLVGTPQAQAAVTCYKHDYIGNIEYQNNALEAYYTEEGRINYAQGNRHEYTIKDHLGNTRVCFTPNPSNLTSTLPKILQQTNYYAYGLPIGNLSRTYPLTTGGAFALEDKYQYNQKELNNDFGLLWNDYGARWYDPQLARWHQIDPLTEKYAAWSGYNYVLGNPMRLVDPTGMFGEYELMGGEKTKVSNLGDEDGIDFIHHLDGERKGQTEIYNTQNCYRNWIGNSDFIRGYKQRGKEVSWKNIFTEWWNGNDPENSLMYGNDNPMNMDIMHSKLFKEVANKYAIEKENTGITKQHIPMDFGLMGIWKSGTNMTMQMVGSSGVSFYELGSGRTLVILTDSKTRESFYYRAPVDNIKRGNYTISDGDGGTIYDDRRANTNQTYIWVIQEN